MTDYHEPWERLAEEDRAIHRALASLREEIEAVDWYHQRVCLTEDQELKRVLSHNRDEEIEHACMTLEWLRRRVSSWDLMLSRYLNRPGPIVTESDELEGGKDHSAAIGGKAPQPATSKEDATGDDAYGSLGIGSLRPYTFQETGS